MPGEAVEATRIDLNWQGPNAGRPRRGGLAREGLFGGRAVRRIAPRRASGAVASMPRPDLPSLPSIARGALETMMSPSHLRPPTLALLFLISACSFANDTLWPTLSGEDPRGLPPATIAASPTSQATISAVSLADGAPGATAPLGRKAAELHDQLQRLEGEVAQQTRQLDDIRRQLDESANSFDTRAAGIEARLKSRGTPNDPPLLADWNEAQSQLNRTGEVMARLTNISTWSISDGALVSYILQAVRAAGGQPDASDQDRRQLAQLERNANRVSVDVDRLVSQVSGEIAGRNLFVAAAHRRLAALGPAITLGRPVFQAASPAAAAGSRPALVTIRFDRPDVAYQEQLFGAVNEALERRPDIAFDVVAVSPPGAPASSATASKRNMESVVQSLASMGLPADRIRLSARTLVDASGNEVRIYPR
jgi:hypothetical protein